MMTDHSGLEPYGSASLVSHSKVLVADVLSTEVLTVFQINYSPFLPLCYCLCVRYRAYVMQILQGMQDNRSLAGIQGMPRIYGDRYTVAHAAFHFHRTGCISWLFQSDQPVPDSTTFSIGSHAKCLYIPDYKL